MEKDLHIRMSDYDLAVIKEAARYTRLSPSAYARMILLKDAENRCRFFRKAVGNESKPDHPNDKN